MLDCWGQTDDFERSDALAESHKASIAKGRNGRGVHLRAKLCQQGGILALAGNLRDEILFGDTNGKTTGREVLFVGAVDIASDSDARGGDHAANGDC